jgi:hypothetical protein
MGFILFSPLIHLSRQGFYYHWGHEDCAEGGGGFAAGFPAVGGRRKPLGDGTNVGPSSGPFQHVSPPKPSFRHAAVFVKGGPLRHAALRRTGSLTSDGFAWTGPGILTRPSSIIYPYANGAIGGKLPRCMVPAVWGYSPVRPPDRPGGGSC